MAKSLLSQIHKDTIGWTMRVLVSRIWSFRGATDKGPIKHVDLVVHDKEGNHMYAQIPPAMAKELEDILEEGKVYVLKKFLCNESTSAFRVIESPFMIQFTRFSTTQLMEGLENDFPFCTYSLTSFEDLPEPTTTPPRFIDVIGQITSVSDIIQVQAMHQSKPSNTRTIMLKNLKCIFIMVCHLFSIKYSSLLHRFSSFLLHVRSGRELRLVPWGDRAVEFDADTVRTVGESVPVIGIFVGTLPKHIQVTKVLSGGAACRWYINEDIPDINSFRTRLGDQFSPVISFAPSERESLSVKAREEPTERTVEQLRNLDPFDNKGKQFLCTVTIESMNPDQRRWFFSCDKCRRSASPVGSVYNCANPACSSIKADSSYCLCVIAYDETAKTEFMLFDKVTRIVTGKPAMSLLHRRYPSYATFQEMAQVAKADRTVPSEITRMIGKKYQIVVSISSKSFAPNSRELSFQVNRIVEAFKPEISTSPFDHIKEPAGSSSTQPPDLPMTADAGFTPRTPSASNIAHATNLSGDLGVTQMSPPLQPPTPQFALAGGSDVPMGPSKVSCPRRGARTSLFSTPPKGKQGCNEIDSATISDHIDEDPPADVADPNPQTKTKRTTIGTKGSGGGKKTKL